MLTHCPFQGYLTATRPCPLRLAIQAAVVGLFCSVAVIGSLGEWWPLWLWIGCSMLTAYSLTPPWSERIAGVVGPWLPVKRLWANYFVLAVVWVITFVLLFLSWTNHGS
jgi:hypothetical protein